MQLFNQFNLYVQAFSFKIYLLSYEGKMCQKFLIHPFYLFSSAFQLNSVTNYDNGFYLYVNKNE